MIEYKYVVVGNGPAGGTAVQELRKGDEKGSVLVVSESEYLSYRRPGLIDYLAGKKDFNSMVMKDKEFYARNNIDLMLSTSVVSIDPENSKIELSTGEVISYEKLLLASGAHSFVPPVPGMDKKGVFSFRWKWEADEIRSYTEDHPRVTVIGGGLLGLETANSLISLGKDVGVVEVFEYLLPKQLDIEASSILKDMLIEKGFRFHLGSTLSEVKGRDKVERIVFKSNEEIDTDALIISIGIRSNISLPKEAGIECDKGVVVDDHMRTSTDNIYAAGDIAQHNGITYGLIKPSIDQARIAARNMTGAADEYKGTPIESRIKVTGISLFSAGDFNSDQGEVRVKKEGRVYKKVIIDKDRVTGAIILGDQSAVNTVSSVYNGRKDLSEIDKVF